MVAMCDGGELIWKLTQVSAERAVDPLTGSLLFGDIVFHKVQSQNERLLLHIYIANDDSILE